MTATYTEREPMKADPPMTHDYSILCPCGKWFTPKWDKDLKRYEYLWHGPQRICPKCDAVLNAAF